MMNFTWRSRKCVDVPAVNWHDSAAIDGVKFSIRQISLGSRLELMKSMRELLEKNEFLRAGDVLGQTDAAISDLMAKALYLRWGLRDVKGLNIGNRAADAESLIENGPEALCNEIVSTIREHLELSESERKNF